MSTEYGYELFKCPACKSLTYFPGEGCSQCKGEYISPTEDEISRMLESGRIFGKREEKSKANLQEQQLRNEKASADYRAFKNDIVQLKAEVAVEITERARKPSGKIDRAIRRERENLRSFNKLAKVDAHYDAFSSLFRWLYIAMPYTYADHRKMIALEQLRYEAKANYYRVTGVDFTAKSPKTSLRLLKKDVVPQIETFWSYKPKQNSSHRENKQKSAREQSNLRLTNNIKKQSSLPRREDELLQEKQDEQDWANFVASDFSDRTLQENKTTITYKVEHNKLGTENASKKEGKEKWDQLNLDDTKSLKKLRKLLK